MLQKINVENVQHHYSFQNRIVFVLQRAATSPEIDGDWWALRALLSSRVLTFKKGNVFLTIKGGGIFKKKVFKSYYCLFDELFLMLVGGFC